MKKITKPGIFKNLPYEEYDTIPALRSTYLKKHLECPAATQIAMEETAALRFGIAAHTYLLEGSEFSKRYAVMPDFPCPIDRNERGWKMTNEYKLKKQSFEIDNAGKIIIALEDFTAISTMTKNCLEHPTAKLLLEKFEPETTVVWKDKETGLLCKARIDIAPYQGMKVIADLKTCEDASEFGFRGAINRYHYDFSAAMYLEGVSIALKQDIDLAMWIASEKSKPHRVEVHEMSAARRDRADGLFHETLRAEAICRKNGKYPAWLFDGVIVQE